MNGAKIFGDGVIIMRVSLTYFVSFVNSRSGYIQNSFSYRFYYFDFILFLNRNFDELSIKILLFLLQGFLNKLFQEVFQTNKEFHPLYRMVK